LEKNPGDIDGYRGEHTEKELFVAAQWHRLCVESSSESKSIAVSVALSGRPEESRASTLLVFSDDYS
jgi:hypothetical protein